MEALRGGAAARARPPLGAGPAAAGVSGPGGDPQGRRPSGGASSRSRATATPVPGAPPRPHPGPRPYPAPQGGAPPHTTTPGTESVDLVPLESSLLPPAVPDRDRATRVDPAEGTESVPQVVAAQGQSGSRLPCPVPPVSREVSEYVSYQGWRFDPLRES